MKFAVFLDDVFGHGHEAPGFAGKAEISPRIRARWNFDRLGLLGEASRLADDHGGVELLGELEGRPHHVKPFGGGRRFHHGHFEH